MEGNKDEISLDDLIVTLKQQWKVILLPAVAAALGVFFVFRMKPAQYEAYSLIRIGINGPKAFESPASLKAIMVSEPMVEEIAKRMASRSLPLEQEYIQKRVFYEDMSDLLKVSARTDSKEKSLLLVRSAIDVLYERHQNLYAGALKELEVIVRYIRTVVNPVPLSSGLSEFRIEPTKIEVVPFAERNPLPKRAKFAAMIAFSVTLVLCLFAAFYLQGKKSRKNLPSGT